MRIPWIVICVAVFGCLGGTLWRGGTQSNGIQVILISCAVGFVVGIIIENRWETMKRLLVKLRAETGQRTRHPKKDFQNGGIKEHAGSAIGMIVGLAFTDLLFQLARSYGAVLGWLLTAIVTAAVVAVYVVFRRLKQPE
jgi:uncharacterized membrane protein YraQ (UPF0718 family)